MGKIGVIKTKKEKTESGGHGLMQYTLDKMASEWRTKYREGKSNANIWERIFQEVRVACANLGISKIVAKGQNSWNSMTSEMEMNSRILDLSS